MPEKDTDLLAIVQHTHSLGDQSPCSTVLLPPLELLQGPIEGLNAAKWG